jgi:hypothetical protein
VGKGAYDVKGGAKKSIDKIEGQCINEPMNMNRLLIFGLSFFFMLGVVCMYSQSIDSSGEHTVEPRWIYIPSFSYSLASFNTIQLHSPVAGLTTIHYNPVKKNNLSSVLLRYSPQILKGIRSDYPGLYHGMALSFAQKIDRHTLTGTLVGMTDKPVYGGLNTFIGMAGYSNNVIKGEHFSMSLGINLLVMDIGVTLDKGMPWLLWPIPVIRLDWQYTWINVGLTPMPRLVIGPDEPFCLIAKVKTSEYDVSFWYRYLKNNNPAVERLGIGIGIKKDTNKVGVADGRSYEITYNALYGTVRLFRLLEISGGWLFNSKESYTEANWNKLLASSEIDGPLYNDNTGHGFFIAISARILF